MAYHQNTKYRIAICTFNSASGYSGGRYHAWMMAEALANRGHSVTVWTNNKPAFLNDFKDFPGHSAINLVCSTDFRDQPAGQFDLVVLIPHFSTMASDFYPKTILLALQQGAKLILLNFETPNWFNSLSPEPRDTALWRDWKRAGACVDLILSSSAEGNRFARGFYTNASGSTKFSYCYPSINSLVADRVKIKKREKQIICITRFVKGDKHKGGQELLKILGPQLSGHTLAILIGVKTIPATVKELLIENAQRYEVKIKLLHGLNDYQKFKEIKRSKLMIFLSFFEGFGLPPIEALYCQTPCIAYDLPVLREVSGDGLIYVPPGDDRALQESIHKVLKGEIQFSKTLNERVSQTARFESYAERLNDLICEQMQTPRSQTAVKDSSFNFLWTWFRLKDLENKELQKAVKTSEKYLNALEKDALLKLLIKMRFKFSEMLKKIIPASLFERLLNLYRKM